MPKRPVHLLRWLFNFSAGPLLFAGAISFARADDAPHGPAVEPGMTAAQVRQLTGLDVPDTCSADNQFNNYKISDEEIDFGFSGLVWMVKISYKLDIPVKDEETFLSVIKEKTCHSGRPSEINFLPGYFLQRDNLVIGDVGKENARRLDLYLWSAEWAGKISTMLQTENGLQDDATYSCIKSDKTLLWADPEKRLCPDNPLDTGELPFCERFYAR